MKPEFKKVLEYMIRRSGGSLDKVNLDSFYESLSDSFIYPWNRWLGVVIEKNPLDLMVLQEIIFEARPDTIIECGTCYGGSAYFMASIMDLAKIDGRVFTIDHEIYPPNAVPYSHKKTIRVSSGKKVNLNYDLYQARPIHPKIVYIHSDCLKAKIPNHGKKTMVVLDCNHSPKHVEEELKKYAPLVSVGQYLIIEDMLIPDRKKGPKEPVEDFLRNHPNFIVDQNRERFKLSSNHQGYLERIQ